MNNDMFECHNVHDVSSLTRAIVLQERVVGGIDLFARPDGPFNIL